MTQNPNFVGDQVGMQLTERTFIDVLTRGFVYAISPTRAYPPRIFPPLEVEETVPEPSDTVIPEMCPDCETETDFHARTCAWGGEL